MWDEERVKIVTKGLRSTGMLRLFTMRWTLKRRWKFRTSSLGPVDSGRRMRRVCRWERKLGIRRRPRTEQRRVRLQCRCSSWPRTANCMRWPQVGRGRPRPVRWRLGAREPSRTGRRRKWRPDSRRRWRTETGKK